jgi:hypothetical protein
VGARGEGGVPVSNKETRGNKARQKRPNSARRSREGERRASPSGIVFQCPVPLMGIELLPAVTLSVTTNDPARAPFVVGAKVTSMVQLSVGGSEAGHKLSVEKLAELLPVIVTLVMSKAVPQCWLTGRAESCCR